VRSLKLRSTDIAWIVLAIALITIFMAFPTLAHAQSVPIPEKALWESKMVQFGEKWGAASLGYTDYNTRLGHTYYDSLRVYYQIADYTKDSKWIQYANRARENYRDIYVIPNNGGAPGYWNFTNGLRMDFERTGDVKSKQAVFMLAKNGAYCLRFYHGDAEIENLGLIREISYCLMAKINAEALSGLGYSRALGPDGVVYDTRREFYKVGLINQLNGMVDEKWRGSTLQVSPFMLGLAAEALILDWENTKDTRIIPVLKRTADYMWLKGWDAGRQGIRYNINPTAAPPDNNMNGSPDLNQLLSPTYAFLFKQTGETKYRDQGDAMFAGGARLASVDFLPKQFNQNYRWSFDYVKWRGGTVVDPQPPGPITVKLNAPSVAQGQGLMDVTVPLTATTTGPAVRVSFLIVKGPAGTTPETMTTDMASPWAMDWHLRSDWTPAGVYELAAAAENSLGAVTVSPSVMVTVVHPLPPVDTQAPGVAVNIPIVLGLQSAPRQIVSGTVTINAVASDNVGVSRVEFFIDGVLKSTSTVAPYSYAWDTTDGGNHPCSGPHSHVITAKAYDAAGNVGTSQPLVVDMGNPPYCPEPSPTAIGTTEISVAYLRVVGTPGKVVASVQFYVNGVAYSAADTQGSIYSRRWGRPEGTVGPFVFTAVVTYTDGSVETVKVEPAIDK
jgi:hypothetical protein